MSNPQVELHIANYGVITLELNEEKAPNTVANFLSYVKKGHYDNTIFHRVIPGFMVQGGGMEPGMKEKRGDKPINNEANNGLKKFELHRGHGPYRRASFSHSPVFYQRR